MTAKILRIFNVNVATGFCFIISACVHDKAWIASKGKNSGRIGYYQSTFSDNREAVVTDFNKVAAKICGSSNWMVVREIIPPPTSAVSAVRNASKGDVKGTADSSRQVLIHDVIYRSKRVDKQVKVEYGSPLKSWNEAEVRCK